MASRRPIYSSSMAATCIAMVGGSARATAWRMCSRMQSSDPIGTQTTVIPPRLGATLIPALTKSSTSADVMR